jgi:hypothetical protein
MYNKKMLLMQHSWLPEAGVEETPGRAGSGKSLYLRTLYIEWRFFLHCQRRLLKGRLLKPGCHIFSSWYYLKHSSICTTGQVVKVNNIDKLYFILILISKQLIITWERHFYH